MLDVSNFQELIELSFEEEFEPKREEFKLKEEKEDPQPSEQPEEELWVQKEDFEEEGSDVDMSDSCINSIEEEEDSSAQITICPRIVRV